ncbi:MAG: hypothetical protein Q7K16_02910 [Candidatus Azambacteria bacterium]|nr:hypothetical protein [Candidatus Azambacteria bacterium]
MNQENVEKLDDYLLGFFSLEDAGNFPIGTLLIEEENRTQVIEAINNRKASILDDSSKNPLQDNFKEVSELIKDGKTIVINSNIGLSPKLYNLFLNFTHGSLSMEVPGEGLKTINPVPKTSKILLIINKELFDTGERFGRIVSSVCRL